MRIMKTNRLTSILVASLASVTLAWGDFTTFNFPGASFTVARGINPQGDIVGSYFIGSGNFHGFLLSQGVFTSIDYPQSIATFLSGINAAGDIVGKYSDTNGTIHEFVLRRGMPITL